MIRTAKRKHVPKVDKGPTGPKGKYSPDIPARAYKLVLAGLTDPQLAVAFGVHPSTIENWKYAYPEFRLALERGKSEADANVAHSMYKRALGYSHPDTQFFKIYDKTTKETKIIAQEYIKHYAPDTTACIFWLKNRQRQHWSDVQKLEHSGTIATVDLQDTSDEELKFLAKIGLKIDVGDE